MSAYHHLINRATDEHIRRLSPTDTAVHDRRLGAVAERSPAKSGMAEVLVSMLRSQEENLATVDVEARVARATFDFRQSLRRLFSAGFLGTGGPVASSTRFLLCLF